MRKTFGWLFLSLLCLFPLETGKLVAAQMRPDGVDCIDYVPPAISPNGDGINDFFEVELECVPRQYYLRIVNSRKITVFESRNPVEFWTGKMNGIPLPEGIYFWEIRYANDTARETNQRRGEVILLR